VPDSAEDTSLVSSIIALANGLNLQVVAEGVERQEQLESLKTIGCDAVQGYHIGYPMNHKDFEKYLRQQLNFSKRGSRRVGDGS
jgi:diguanylate cyclase